MANLDHAFRLSQNLEINELARMILAWSHWGYSITQMANWIDESHLMRGPLYLLEDYLETSAYYSIHMPRSIKTQGIIQLIIIIQKEFRKQGML